METFVTLTGAAAVNHNTELPIRGWIETITLTYLNAPATTAVVLTEVGGANRVLLSVSGNTNAIYYPRAGAVDTYGNAISGAAVTHFIPGYPINVSVTGSDAAAVITARITISGDFFA